VKNAIEVAALLLALSGCSMAPTERAAAVRDADDRMVASCQYVGDVEGSSGWGGPLTGKQGMNNSHNEARDKAAALGATHVVWTSVSGNMHDGSMVSAKAYRCP
jgi:hypothetical protein